MRYFWIDSQASPDWNELVTTPAPLIGCIYREMPPHWNSWRSAKKRTFRQICLPRIPMKLNPSQGSDRRRWTRHLARRPDACGRMRRTTADPHTHTHTPTTSRSSSSIPYPHVFLPSAGRVHSNFWFCSLNFSDMWCWVQFNFNVSWLLVIDILLVIPNVLLL
jgi:hypothetical protein